MDGFQQTYKQIQSFELSTQFMGDDFANKNRYPRHTADGNFNNKAGQFIHTEVQGQSETISTITAGLGTGSEKFTGMVLASNEVIYGIPTAATSVLKVNYKDNTFSSFGSLATGNKYQGGVLVGDTIYCFPTSVTDWLKINTVNDSLSTISSLITGPISGVLANNGKIYCAPRNNRILVLNTKNDSQYLISNINNGVFTQDYRGSAQIGNKIYFVPFTANAPVIVLDVRDESYYFIPSIGGYMGAVPYQNKVYFINYTAAAPAVLDTLSDKITILNNVGASQFKYIGGVLAENQKIYGIPYLAGTGATTSDGFLVIDTKTDIATNVGTAPTTVNSAGGCLAPNGRIYCAPRVNNPNITVFLTPLNQDLDINMLMNRERNTL